MLGNYVFAEYWVDIRSKACSRTIYVLPVGFLSKCLVLRCHIISSRHHSTKAFGAVEEKHSRFRRVERVGMVAHVLSAEEDPVGEAGQEVACREVAGDRTNAKAGLR